MKNYFLVFIFTMLSVLVFGQPKLEFRSDGTFKVLQFTDIHYILGTEESKKSIDMINTVLDSEKPDLVVFTGDIVTCIQAKQAWNIVTEPVRTRNIPFAVTLGNHDDESGRDRAMVSSIITKYPQSVNIQSSSNVKGFLNNVLEISGKNNKCSALIYCMDSNSYSRVDTIKGYGWFTSDQIDWYRNKNAHYTKKNGGKAVPALAFCHIPLPEHKTAFDREAPHFGVRNENECAPNINSGLFYAMFKGGDVMSVSVGHDHDNNYIATLYGIALCYGQFSGSKNTYTNMPGNGARVFVLKEGAKAFDTWIRLNDNSIKDKASFPADFK